MNRTSVRWIALVGLLPLWAVSPAGAGSLQKPPPELVGRWVGEADIIVSWCQQEQLELALTIHADGAVTGRVGDAVLANGLFHRNSRMLIWLGNSKHYIQGDLHGPIVANEAITRESIRIFVDIVDGQIQGGFHTSGSKGGGRSAMKVTGARLWMDRSDG